MFFIYFLLLFYFKFYVFYILFLLLYFYMVVNIHIINMQCNIILFLVIKLNTKPIKELIKKLELFYKQAPTNSDLLLNNIINTKSESSKIYIYGIGRSGFVGKAFAMRLMHLGFKSHFIGEATCPAVSNNDLLIVVSGSGETYSIVNLLNKINKINNKLELKGKNKIKIISITHNNNCTLKELSDFIVNLAIDESDKTENKCFPMGTLFEEIAFIYLDTIIYNLMEKLNISEEDMKKRHCNFL